MSHYHGRRRATSGRRTWGIAAAGFILIAAASATALARNGSAVGAPTRSTSPGVLTQLPCPETATVAVPTAYLPTWQKVAEAYAAQLDRPGCSPVKVVSGESAAIATAAPADLDAWVPEDKSWAERAAKPVAARFVGQPTELAVSPLVLVMPTPMASAAGVTKGTFTPATLRDMITLERTWGDVGHSEWGTLRLAIPDPAASATGAIAFAALAQVATDGKVPSTLDYANPNPAQLALIRLEHRVAATATGDATVLDTLQPLTARVGALDPAGPGMWVTTEAVALRRDTAQPTVAVYLGGGAAAVHMAMVTFDGPGAATVARFQSYLTAPAGQAALAAAGLRTSSSAPTSTVLDAAGIVSASGGKPAVVVPTAAVVTAGQTFGFMHTRVSSLVVLDVSGSMKDRLPGSSIRKIDLVKGLAKQTLTVASPQARSGVVTFRSDAKDTMVIRLAAGLLANGSDDRGVPHSTRVLEAVNSAAVGGGTPLYDATVFGYERALAAYDAKFVNQVVVLTDGANRDARGSISRESLVSRLKALADPKRPIKLILLGYGQDADMATLRAIAAATGGKAVAVPTLSSVGEATRQALFTP